MAKRKRKNVILTLNNILVTQKKEVFHKSIISIKSLTVINEKALRKFIIKNSKIKMLKNKGNIRKIKNIWVLIPKKVFYLV